MDKVTVKDKKVRIEEDDQERPPQVLNRAARRRLARSKVVRRSNDGKSTKLRGEKANAYRSRFAKEVGDIQRKAAEAAEDMESEE